MTFYRSNHHVNGSSDAIFRALSPFLCYCNVTSPLNIVKKPQ